MQVVKKRERRENVLILVRVLIYSVQESTAPNLQWTAALADACGTAAADGMAIFATW